jgi:probable rRNA maturation factor
MAQCSDSPRILVRSDHRNARSEARAVRRLARAFLVELGLAGAELSLVLTTDARIRRLNRIWRSVDRPTDVLSFPAARHPAHEGRAPSLGDIVISIDTARRRSHRDRRPLERELARYLAHGLLHLVGYDHQRPAQARRMALAEKRLLGGAGMLDASDELD